MKKILLFVLFFGVVVSFTEYVEAGVVSSYTLNGLSESVTFNPNADPVTIDILTNIPVSFSTIAICSVNDSVCGRSTAVKYFTQTAPSSSALKIWNGKTSADIIVPDGEYKIKLTSKVGSNDPVTEDLTPYIIIVSSSSVIPPIGDSVILTTLIAGTGSGTITGKENSYTKGATATLTAVASGTSTFSGWSGACTNLSGTCSVVMDSNKTVTATFTSSSTSSTNPPSSGGGSYYVYSSSVSLSTYEPLNLNVEAGRERLGFLHTPLEFKAYSQDKKTGKNVSNARYYWTFGDGSSAEGNIVSHTYLFAGTYNVVLNSSSGEEDAVDITKVKIIEPKVKMIYTDSYVEFINENSTDLNIGGWKIKGNDREYLLPRDTIISANGNIKIPFLMLGSVSESDKLGVVYPDNQLAFETSRVLGEEKQKQITEISQKLAMLQEELNLAYAGENNLTQFTGIEEGRLISENDVNISEGGKGESEISNTNLANSLSSEASASVLSKIVDFFAGMFR